MSSARNLGLMHISGEYVMFCDSDDYCYPEMLEKLVSVTEYGSIDIVLAKFIVQDRNDIRNISKQPCMQAGKYSNESILQLLYENKIGGELHAKLWKRTLLAGLKFSESMVHSEDAFFSFDLYIKANSLVMIENALYIYFKYRPGNATNAKKKKYTIGPLLYYEKAFEYAKGINYLYEKSSFEMLVKAYIRYYLVWLTKPHASEELLDFDRIKRKIIQGKKCYSLSAKWKIGVLMSLRAPCLIYFGAKPYSLIKKRRK